MALDPELPVEERLVHLFQYLGIAQAHIAACRDQATGTRPVFEQAMVVETARRGRLSRRRVFTPPTSQASIRFTAPP